jgi:two-component system heavy metal sensor histidine kinase CusS
MLQRGLALRITSPDGEVVQTGPESVVPMTAYPRPESNGTAERYVTQKDGHAVVYMTATRSFETRPGRTWLIQAAYDVNDSEALIARFGRRIVELLTYATALAALLGAFIVRRGLRPLRVMSAAITNVTATRLDAQIADQAWPSDLQQLARSFDDMLQRLHAAFEQLSRFSSDLAHEFRSPITNLVSAASVMLTRARSVSEYQETLAVVVENGERLSRLVSSMLFLARADNARQSLHLQPVSIAEQLKQVAEAYACVAEERGIRVAANGQGEAQADIVLLRSALSNLVANALRHTPAGGEVILSAEPLGTGVEIAVTDTGCGIAADHLPHLFERFYRVDAARSDGDRTGLGLALVRSIAELHGGRADAQSKPGHGSRFSIWIPAQSPSLAS